MAALIIAKNPDFFGFTVAEGAAFEQNAIELPGGMDLRTIAKASGIDYSLLRKLNPELKGHITPYEERSYLLRLPEGISTTFIIENFNKLPASEKVVYKEHKVRKGDTVNKIARRYGISAMAIKEVNSLNKRFTIIPGDSILIPESFSFDENYVKLMTYSIKLPDT
jgi:membrane-bound lytic murein transglycosylase D